MIKDALAVLLALITQQEKDKYTSNFIKIRTVAHAHGGAHSPEVTTVATEPEPSPDPIGDGLRADAVAYWKMDESSGNRADSTGRGNDLSENGTVQSTTGKIGNAILLGNTDTEYLTIASNADVSVPGATSFTFAGWVYLDGSDSYANIAYKEGAGQEWMYVLDMDQFPSIKLTIAGSDLSYPQLNGDLMTFPAWNFFVAEFEYGVGLKIQTNNGTPETLEYLLDNIQSENHNLIICRRNITDPMTATLKVDELGFWKRVLTSEERDYLYNSGDGRTLYP